MAKLWEASPGLLVFECPGCGYGHPVHVDPAKGRPLWTWNGSMTAPTFSPSLLLLPPGPRCHSFVEDGRIRFLSDCDHALAGQTVELPEVE